jgi:serine/threonine-protein kinase RsbW
MKMTGGRPQSVRGFLAQEEGGTAIEDRLPDPRSPEALLKESGRGIYLARAFMDEFHVQPGAEGGTTVTLVKHIRGIVCES